jgi:hypothetical protein
MGLLSAHNDNPETTTYHREEKASLERCVDWVQWRLRVKIMAVGKVGGLICVHKKNIANSLHRPGPGDNNQWKKTMAMLQMKLPARVPVERTSEERKMILHSNNNRTRQ